MFPWREPPDQALVSRACCERTDDGWSGQRLTPPFGGDVITVIVVLRREALGSVGAALKG